MLELIIGRDSNSGRLRLTVGGKSMVTGDANSVPKSVSHQHVNILVGDDGSILLTNLNIENDTLVNKRGVETKRIKQGDLIELGKDRYVLDWNILKPFIPVFVDISHLEGLFERYKEQKKKIDSHQRLIGNLMSVPVGSGIIGGVMMKFLPGFESIGGIVTILSGCAWLYGFYLRLTDNSQEKRELLLEKLQHKCVCPNPNCGKYLGFQSYYLIKQAKVCPYCKAIFIEKK